MAFQAPDCLIKNINKHVESYTQENIGQLSMAHLVGVTGFSDAIAGRIGGHLNSNLSLSPKATNLEKKCYLALSSILGEDSFTVEHPIPCIGRCVDVFIPANNLVIEIDGPSHFIKNLNGGVLQYRPVDSLYDRLLKENGFNVLRLPFWELDKLSEDDVVGYISEKIN